MGLTVSQQTSIREITSDLQEDRQMVRLLQGDVGSGKTVVSLSAILSVLDAGKIAIVMAPTLILAQQHYDIITNCVSSVHILDERHEARRPKIGMITGSTAKEERMKIKEGLYNGEYGVLVGTHTLFQNEFYQFLESLDTIGLVVIDEEQRFGVTHRNKIASLSNVLFTTATPIPRSLSLMLQDCIKISTIDDKPAIKRSVKTVVMEQHLSDALIKRIIANIPFGTKAIWVTPLISRSTQESIQSSSLLSSPLDSGGNVVNSPSSGASATERYEEISKLCPGKVGLLHGRLDPKAKEEVVKRFRSGEINILVSTSIIEVGIDIPDVSICVIDQADRFGLSQLHQIRGRVGRGAAPVKERLKNPFCVLLYGKSKDKPHNECDTLEKLKILEDSDDGFHISAADLEMRGPGDLFGSRQHGVSGWKFVSLLHHKDLIEWSKTVATEIHRSDQDALSFLTQGLFPLKIS